ncbi:MAG: C40 family peptidase [Weeksellaceae bacterium]
MIKKRLGSVGTFILSLVVLTSCNTGSNYLTQQQYVPKHANSKVIELQASLKKPIIVPEAVDLINTDEDVFEKLEASTYASSLNVTINNIIYEANSYLGTPYRYGGTTRRGIDCSAFMQKIYNVEGIELPRVSARQSKIGVPVSKGELQKGDLIFFSTTSPTRVTHVGMVVEADDEDVKFIHASSSQGVSIASLSNSYWKRKYRSARRPKQFLNDSLIPMSEVDRVLITNR